MGLWNAWKNKRAKPKMAMVWDVIQSIFLTIICVDLLLNLLLGESPMEALYLAGGSIALIAVFQVMTWFFDTAEDAAFELLVIGLTLIAAVGVILLPSLSAVPVLLVLLVGFGLLWMVENHQLGVFRGVRIGLVTGLSMLMSALKPVGAKIGQIAGDAAASLEARMNEEPDASATIPVARAATPRIPTEAPRERSQTRQE